MSGQADGAVPTAAGMRPIYLDYQATTPVDPRVLDAMLPYYRERFGNPHSRQHALGREAAAAVDEARAEVAALVGAEAREIVFTSGATEANNLALKGLARFYRGRRDHVVTAATEHKCVLESCRWLEGEGLRVTYLPVQADGHIDLDRLAAALDGRTLVVSLMAANNEIGVVHPLAEIGALCRAHGVFFHTDAAQAAGKIPLDVGAMNIDLMSLSAHKLYGPKGIGALYVRRRPRVRIEAQMSGGGQERGMRSGTLAAPLIVGFGAACEIAGREMGAEAARLARLRDRLLAGLRRRIPGSMVNGDMVRRLPGNLNVSFPGVDAEALLEAMPELACSTGSACTSAAIEPSYVLRALGLDEARARGAVRFGLGRFTTEEEVDRAVEIVSERAARLRASGPPGAYQAAG